MLLCQHIKAMRGRTIVIFSVQELGLFKTIRTYLCRDVLRKQQQLDHHYFFSKEMVEACVSEHVQLYLLCQFGYVSDCVIMCKAAITMCIGHTGQHNGFEMAVE